MPNVDMNFLVTVEMDEAILRARNFVDVDEVLARTIKNAIISAMENAARRVTVTVWPDESTQ